MTIAEMLTKVSFPIYGIVGCPLGFTLFSSGLTTGEYSLFSLAFTIPYNPAYPFDESVRTFVIRTSDRNERQQYAPLNKILRNREQPMRNPFAWEGTIILEGKLFNGAIRYHTAPLRASGFHFNSEKLFLSGASYGPSCDEVIELLEGLQVLNGRDDVLKQYDEPRDL